MRIAVWHDPPPGGARRAVAELTRRLATRHTVDVYLLGSGDEGPAPEAVYGAPVHVTPFRFRRHRRAAPYWNDVLTFFDLQDVRRFERTLAARIDAAGYDVAFVSVLRSGQAPAILGALSTPVAYFCHEPPRRFYEPWCRPEAGPMSRYERARRLWRRPAHALLDAIIKRRDLSHVRRAHLVLTNSEYTRGRIRSVYGRDAKVCHLGVDATLWRPAGAGDGSSPSGVISVGTLEAHKGFDFLVRALGRIPPAHRPALTIVGGGGHPAMPAHLRDLARQHGVTLHLRSGLSDEELASLYRSHALFCFGARFEPFGLVILEAMACGLPVVAVAEGGVPESVRHGETGYLVPRDEAEFAQAVARLLVDPALRRTMASAAREVAVSRWTWEAATRRVEAHLTSLSGAGAPAPAYGIAPISLGRRGLGG
ncbi:MAG TPA: glycosyltransferase family 4 protein [Chloroflexota bacterium]|nr:glycosyltransferase family 4 protein [Chloroflexota bacterium]